MKVKLLKAFFLHCTSLNINESDFGSRIPVDSIYGLVRPIINKGPTFKVALMIVSYLDFARWINFSIVWLCINKTNPLQNWREAFLSEKVLTYSEDKHLDYTHGWLPVIMVTPMVRGYGPFIPLIQLRNVSKKFSIIFMQHCHCCISFYFSNCTFTFPV